MEEPSEWQWGKEANTVNTGSSASGWWSIHPPFPTVTTEFVDWSADTMNNTEKAFQVAKQLMADQLVVCNTPDEFIKLVEAIAKAL